jgi:hypothetical protein
MAAGDAGAEPGDGAYAAKIAALAAQTAVRLGAQAVVGRAGRECSTAFGAVAVCTRSTG